jgi:hypothetical protein
LEVAIFSEIGKVVEEINEKVVEMENRESGSDESFEGNGTESTYLESDDEVEKLEKMLGKLEIDEQVEERVEKLRKEEKLEKVDKEEVKTVKQEEQEETVKQEETKKQEEKEEQEEKIAAFDALLESITRTQDKSTETLAKETIPLEEPITKVDHPTQSQIKFDTLKSTPKNSKPLNFMKPLRKLLKPKLVDSSFEQIYIHEFLEALKASNTPDQFEENLENCAIPFVTRVDLVLFCRNELKHCKTVCDELKCMYRTMFDEMLK